MDLFSLTAKLTLDTQAYEAKVARARASAQSLAGALTRVGESARTASALMGRMPSQSGAAVSAAAPAGAAADRAFSSAKNAHGLGYVPYDDYPAWLHRGEAVLTRADAQAYRAQGALGGAIDYGALGEAVAGAVREALAGVAVTMSGERVGELVSRRIALDARKGRYAP